MNVMLNNSPLSPSWDTKNSETGTGRAQAPIWIRGINKLGLVTMD